MSIEPAEGDPRRGGAAGDRPERDPYDIAGYFGDEDEDSDEVTYGRTDDGGYTATFRAGPQVWVVTEKPEGPLPPPPPGLSKQTLARRAMAEQLTDDLVDPPYRQEGFVGHDWAHAAIDVPLAYPPVWEAYQQSQEVITEARATPGEVTISEGWDGTGLVFRVHGPQWSLVMASNGPQQTVYLCRDDMPEVPLKVEPEDQRERILSVFWFTGLLGSMQRVALGGDYLPPKWAAAH